MYNNEKLPHIIIVGGGFAGLDLVKGLGKKPYRVTLFDKNNYFTFQPMLYQVAAGGIGPDGIAYPLRKIVSRYPNIRFRMAEVLEVKPKEKELITNIGNFEYDYLVVAIGAQTNFFGNSGFEKNTFQLKSVTDSLRLRSAILLCFEKALCAQSMEQKKRLLTFAIVGGGPTGVETAGSIVEMKKHVLPSDYKELDASLMEVYLIEASPRLLSGMSETSSEAVHKFLVEMGVHVLLKTAVDEYDGTLLTLNTRQVIATETVVWAAGVKAAVLPGLPAGAFGRNGRLLVNETNRVKGFDNIFALGDAALMEGDPKFPNGHAMIGTPAQQQARHLAKNFVLMAKGKPEKPFRYFDPGTMATVGRHKAVMEIFGMKFKGLFAWFGWMFLHLMLLVGFRNRVVVFVHWLWNYISYDRSIRLITKPGARDTAPNLSH
jgi:NADH dehydrogenase